VSNSKPTTLSSGGGFGNFCAALFFGDYEKTPFALHDGESSNFKFVIEGRKKLQLWPDKFFG